MDEVNKGSGDIVKKSVLLSMKFHNMTNGGYFPHIVNEIMQYEKDDLTFPYNLALPVFKEMNVDPKFIDLMNALKEMKKQRVCKYGDYEIAHGINYNADLEHVLRVKNHPQYLFWHFDNINHSAFYEDSVNIYFEDICASLGINEYKTMRNWYRGDFMDQIHKYMFEIKEASLMIT